MSAVLCRRGFMVQDAEDGHFLAADGEGGILLVRMLSRAVPFSDEEAAAEAVAEHLGGCGVVVPVWVPVDSGVFA